MATKRKRNTAYDPPKNNGGFVGYVDCRLTSDDKARFDVWCQETVSDGWVTFLDTKMDDDYTFSLKHDNYGGGVQASLMCKLKSSPDNGLVLTARAPDVWNAMMLLVFKATEMMTEDWVNYVDLSKERDQWG